MTDALDNLLAELRIYSFLYLDIELASYIIPLEERNNLILTLTGETGSFIPDSENQRSDCTERAV